jgi:hypothetical protein
MKCLSVVTAGIEGFIAEQEIQGEKASNAQMRKGNDGLEIYVSDEEHMGAWLPPVKRNVM